MDPVSIVSLVDASIGLTLKCASAIKYLNDLASKFKYAELTIRSITQYLDIMQLSWDRIARWAEEYSNSIDVIESGIAERIARFIETGSLVMDAFEKDLPPVVRQDLTAVQRVRLVWNEDLLLAHRERMRDQATSMSLLLQAITLQVFGSLCEERLDTNIN